MSAKARKVGDYLAELEKLKAGKTDQVREGLEAYIDLWKKTVERGVVDESDGVEAALEKIDGKGGLYQAAGV